jgi:VWFA-related protein
VPFTRIVGRLLVSALCLSVSIVHVSSQQPAPVFRAGVDLVTVDVVVLDRSGRPIVDLAAADFALSTNNQPRRLVSAEFVAAVAREGRPGGPSGPPTEGPPVPSATTNIGRAAGRSFLFLVDTDEIRRGEGRGAAKAISTFIDRLGPDDRVGVVSMPTGTPRVDLTTNRLLVKDALGKITGTSNRFNECAATPGEALGIAQGDERAQEAYGERLSGLSECQFNRPPVSLALTQYRQHTRGMLEAASALASAMASIDGPKTLVLVSGGLLVDDDLRDEVSRFGGVLERARVAFYGLHLDPPLGEAASRSNSMRTGLLDDRVGFDGMADAAFVARGTAIRVLTDATAALGQIDSELSGYYLLAFERAAADKDDARLRLSVRVSRAGADVRVRRFVTIAMPKPPPPTTGVGGRAAVGELLRSPATASGLGLAIDAYASPAAQPTEKASVILVADIAETDRPIKALGYEIVNEAGKVVEDSFDEPPKLLAYGARRHSYLVSVALAAGSYRVKLGVVDEEGRRGSIEHPFVVAVRSAGDVRVGDVIFGDDRSGALRPLASVTADVSRLVIRVDLEGTPEAFREVRARLTLRKAGAPEAALDEASLSLRDGSRPSRRIVASAIDVQRLASGTYDVLVTVATPAGNVTVSRRFSTAK